MLVLLVLVRSILISSVFLVSLLGSQIVASQQEFPVSGGIERIWPRFSSKSTSCDIAKGKAIDDARSRCKKEYNGKPRYGSYEATCHNCTLHNGEWTCSARATIHCTGKSSDLETKTKQAIIQRQVSKLFPGFQSMWRLYIKLFVNRKGVGVSTRLMSFVKTVEQTRNRLLKANELLGTRSKMSMEEYTKSIDLISGELDSSLKDFRSSYQSLSVEEKKRLQLPLSKKELREIIEKSRRQDDDADVDFLTFLLDGSF